MPTHTKQTHKIYRLIFLFLVILIPAKAFCGQSILLETENFQHKGGWVIDQQSVNVIGSSYLLAHGMGKPVENAKTEITFPAKGKYQLWVRTRNWMPGKWKAPGQFKILIDGKPVKTVFGTQPGWDWQNGGTVNIKNPQTTIELQDMTGFDGRCDAIYFTQDKNNPPPNELKAMLKWREKLTGITDEPNIIQTFDVVIVGGGTAGCAAAMAAAEEGLTAALINDRPTLGGNASEEIRIHTQGHLGTENTRRLLKLIGTTPKYDGDGGFVSADQKRIENIKSQKNIQLFLSQRAFRVNMNGSVIQSVDAKHIETGKVQRFCAPLFIDCTGDGWIGYWAGAEYRYGRESKNEFNEGWPNFDERWSPNEPDKRILGSSVLWTSQVSDRPSKFPAVPWAMPIAKDYTALKGKWYWEYTDNDVNQIDDAEKCRDIMLCAIYGSFANAKKDPENANRELKWVGYLAGKRESRRLIGDYIYTLKDSLESTDFPDAVVVEQRIVDLHYQRYLDGSPYIFLSKGIWTPKSGKDYYVPFRCLYSKNIDNLMMAGRCFSSSHIGTGGPRVMNTTGQMGIATGYAAALCKKYNTTPRGIYKEHITELRSLIGYK
jgi:hypothetical protein